MLGRHDRPSLRTRYREALRRGHVAVVRGRPREAIAHYEEAGRLAGQRPLPFVSMGSVYLQMHQPREALAAFDEALRRAPGRRRRHARQDRRARGRRPHRGGHLAGPPQRRAGGHGARRPRLRDRGRGAPTRARGACRRGSPGEGGRRARPCRGRLPRGRHRLRRRRTTSTPPWTPACGPSRRVRVPSTCTSRWPTSTCSRGWAELGVQRVMLIDERLDIDGDPRRRSALRALARDFRALAPELELLAAAVA